ncbi:MAG: hypothetical protein EBU07_16785 [Betaproteobacteria bacterium]|jgi:uncharacterized protein (TIGR02001 family)|nr:hypothetical protein [Betaproteobacteria bacterium]NBS47855.1 hypothetical protein [Betaproteobacteria bacterium]
MSRVYKSAALAGALLTAVAGAQAQSAPEDSLTYNVGAVTEYRYRGISQSGKKPAVQFGADFVSKSGFYVGGWASTITWIRDSTKPSTTKGPLEVDIYGGYKGSISDSLSYDVGALQYWYTGNTLGKASGFANANTLEVYGALTSGIFTAKYSHSLTNLFGTVNSKGSTYLDLSATIDLGNGMSLVPHIGHQNIKNFTSYSDYSLTLAKDIDGLVLSAALIGTSKKNFFTLPGSGGKDLGGTTLVLGVKKNF